MKLVDEMKGVFLRLGLILAQTFAYFHLVTGIHEQGHMLMANWVGVEGKVRFWGTVGKFYYPEGSNVLWWQDALIGLAGGGMVALTFGILWAIQHWNGRESKTELDTAAIFAIITIWQFSYAISETINWGADWLQLAGTLGAIAVVFKLYRRRFMKLLGGACWLFPFHRQWFNMELDCVIH